MSFLRQKSLSYYYKLIWKLLHLNKIRKAYCEQRCILRVTNLIFKSTVGIWILTIWIMETFEYQIFWSWDCKWLVIRLMCDVLCNGPTSTQENKMAIISRVFKWYLFDHSNTKLVWYSDPPLYMSLNTKQY